MSHRVQTRRKHLLSASMPVLTLALTVGVAFFVAVPSLVVPPKASSTPTVSSSVVTRGSTIPLPGQGTPHGIELQVGPGTPAGDSRVVRMKLGGRERGYLLLPAVGLPPTTPAALLVVLHQDVGSARAVAQGLGLDALRRQGVALAYPAGVAGSWNAGTCCGQAKDAGVDDVEFVDQVFDDVSRRLNIDPRRRGLLGYSGGGMLTYRVLCQGHPDLAVAVEVSGSLEAACPTDVTLPDMLSIHGALDGTIGLSKPVHVTRLGITPRTVLSTLSTMTWLAGCGDRSSRDLDGVRYLHWQACRGGSSLDVQIVAGAGHGWDDIGAAERAMPFLVQRLARRT